MSQNLAEQRDTLQPRIDAALTQLGQFAGDGSAFKLVLEPSDEALDAAVGAEHDWARGQLYTTVAEYLEQLNFNLGKMSKAVGRAIDGAAPWREVRFRLDGFDGGLVTGQTIFNDGRLDLVFRVDSLKTNQAGWSDIGLDMHDALARCGKAPSEEEVSAAVETPKEAVGPAPEASTDRHAAIDAHLKALGDFVGDGVAWTYAWAADPAELDAAVTRERSELAGTLYDTLDEVLGHLVTNVKRDVTADDLLAASPARRLVFEFVDYDECPRQYLGSYQAVCKGDALHFVGPAVDWNTWGPNRRIGSDVPKALQAKRGESGPTEKERQLAEALGAIAATSSKQSGGGDGTGKTCRMCGGTGRGTCNACHGKGCTRCDGSGYSKSKCMSCKGAGAK